MATVHSYARFSHASQATGDSATRQDSALLKFVEDGEHVLSDLRYFDKGRSAFKGDKQKHLSEFMKILRAKDGRIKAGDILFVEAIDRISRKGIRATQDTVNEILNHGVDIAIHTPLPKVYRAEKTNDLGDSIELAAFAFAAHTYSALLSGRVKGFHSRARAKAQKDGTVIESGAPPTWLERINGKFVVKPGAKKIIRLIFKRVIEGYGQAQICKELNATCEPFTGRSKVWNGTFIRMLTADPRVTGIFQPKETDENGKRYPSGPPIKDYFPAILSEDEFLMAARARKNRLKERGPSGDYLNIFTGIVHHAVDKAPCHIMSYQKYNAKKEMIKYRRLVSVHNRYKVGNWSKETVDIEFFEQAVFRFLRGLDLSVFNGDDHRDNDTLNEMLIILEEKKSRLKEIEESITTSRNLKFLISAGEKVQLEIEELEKQVDELKAQNLNNPASALAQVQTLSELDNTRENRQLLREAVKRVVKRIVILPVKLGPHKASPIGCLIEIELLNGTRQSILQLLGTSIAFTDFNPTGPGLYDRPNILKYKEVIKKTFKTLFKIK